MQAPPRRGWAFSPVGFVRRVFVGAYEDDILFLGSALAFDALLASVPFALLLLAALGYFVHAGEEAAMGDVVTLLDRVIPTSVEGDEGYLRQAEGLIAGVVRTRGQLSIVGIPLFLYFSTRFFGAARAALNEVFDTHETRPFFYGKLVDLSLVLATLVLLVANAFLTLRFAEESWISRFLIGLWTYGIGVMLFFLVYKAAPTRPMKWDTAIVAAAVAALGYEIAKNLYGLYLTEFLNIQRLISNSNAIAVLLLVVWVYAIAVVFLIGSEVAETYDLMRRQREQRAILA